MHPAFVTFTHEYHAARIGGATGRYRLSSFRMRAEHPRNDQLIYLFILLRTELEGERYSSFFIRIVLIDEANAHLKHGLFTRRNDVPMARKSNGLQLT